MEVEVFLEKKFLWGKNIPPDVNEGTSVFLEKSFIGGTRNSI